MKVGIFVKPHRVNFAERLEEILAWLSERGCRLLIADDVIVNYSLRNWSGVSPEEIPGNADFIVVFGGDGTILSVARMIGDYETPLLGVNLGTLGFLTSVKLDETLPALQVILDQEHSIDRRLLLKAEVRRPGEDPIFFDALNDLVINKGALARIICVEAFIEKAFIARFLADGLIVSTPTGSTAYSLSAGGPILFPNMAAVIVTPICPHTLTNRPIVVPSDRSIRMVLEEADDVMVTVDGQVGVRLDPGAEIICWQSNSVARLISPSNKSFFEVLREKLKWGER